MNAAAARADSANRASQPHDLDHQMRLEAGQTALRRAALFGAGAASASFDHDQNLQPGPGVTTVNWALALSGGGIRSATFCLGVLQELAHPGDTAVKGLPPHAKAAYDQVGGLLPQFDYVSSVSGGGFTAGFMQALYAQQPGPPRQAAAKVNLHIAEEPPARVHRHVLPSPLAWLRENGRYLAPSGAGDMAYAFGFGARNWLGIQSVIGAPIVFVTALLALAACVIAPRWPTLDPKWWWLPLATLVCWVLPTAGAYWMTRDVPDGATQAELPWLRIVGVLAAGMATFIAGARWQADLLPFQWCWTGYVAPLFDTASQWPMYLTLCSLVLLLTVAWAIAARCRRWTTTSKGVLAVRLTRLCTWGIQCVGVLLMLALVLEVAQEVLAADGPHPILVSGGGAGILALAYRTVMKLVPLLRGAGSSVDKVDGVPRRGLAVALSILGFLLLLGVGVFWTAAAQWLMRTGGPEPWTSMAARHLTPFQALAAIPLSSSGTLALLSLVFVVVAGRWRSILNMSSYHHFYSSRLTRAYLGAANPQRTTAGAALAPVMTATTGVARFVDGDSIDYRNYFSRPASPLHLINATLNQTVDPAEQLVQRDRKGKPFVVLPPTGTAGPVPSVDVAIGDEFFRVTGAGACLSIGDWLAISGAAVSTGMGRQTSAGAAICVTMANARIGRWWEGPDGADCIVRRLFPTYLYLLDELRGRFQGDHRRLLYLTDGGHFDNTAMYELLRRMRNPDTVVRFVLACDCGADPDYRYDDLANLVRLARIDFQLEVEIDTAVTMAAPLNTVFGTPSTMGAADPERLDTRCAVLLNVRHGGDLLARVVMIKPRLIACASSDLLGYYRNNPVFPQQTTGDQFFDEGQWESYRKLGVECCRAVLGLGLDLWHAVL